MKKSKVAVAVATAVGAAGAAQAADIAVTLTNVATGSNNGTTVGVLSGTLTGTYNTGTGVVTMDAGTSSAGFFIGPTALFTHNHSGWSTGAGSYSATAYSCTEGGFGGTVGAHLCGNYSFTDFINESSVNYSGIPGTRTLGGDDAAVGPQQQGSDYAATTFSYSGGQLVMNTALWGAGGGAGFGTTSTGGVQLAFSAGAIPVPAAVWLFGSALGLLGWVRRRATA